MEDWKKVLLDNYGDDIKSADELNYVNEFNNELLESFSRYGQANIELVNEEPILVDRIFQIHRPIKYYDLQSTGVYRIPFIHGGMFMILPCWILPSDKISKCRRNRWKAILRPEEYGLPSSKVVNYATASMLPNGNYVALPSNLDHPVFDYLISAKHIQYANPDDIMSSVTE